LGASDESTRRDWRGALERLEDRQPTTVIAGHKPTLDTPDSPEALGTMVEYLALFDEALERSSSGGQVAEAVRMRYPWSVVGLLNYSARFAFERRGGA
jgi:hypothetical protein